MFRNRNWFSKNIWKPKNLHSLDHLKYLYNVLSKNQTVSDYNRGLLVETLRSIAEILIWGDQNDSSVFDFFLEKNMLSFFLKILKQKCGSYVCVQLLQTLNILFENIRNETSLYYLLSNNHVNSIIVHKFDFSDEEVMAYYISFLKTLSLKLNSHTIHFFYNEHTNDFPLYTEAIKFFNHQESMVRIAVRTLTLNVYRVDDRSMLSFIRNRTAAPYFTNLVWFIGNHILELDSCIQNDVNRQEQNHLSDLVAEHLDHLHYLNDILCLNIDLLNSVLIEHFLNKLLIPLYIMSLVSLKNISPALVDKQPRISSALSLFLLSQVFLIVNQCELVHTLARIVICGHTDSYLDVTPYNGYSNQNNNSIIKSGFSPPTESLEESLENSGKITSTLGNDTADISQKSVDGYCTNITDEEKEQRLVNDATSIDTFWDIIMSHLSCNENDYSVLFVLCLLHAISMNAGIGSELLDTILIPGKWPDGNFAYDSVLVEHLIEIISLSCQSGNAIQLRYGCRVRLITLELTIMLLKRLITVNGKSILRDEHFAAVVGAKEESTTLLRNFYKSEDIFLDMFEDEYYSMKKRPLNIEWLLMDSNILLKPAGTPMTGVEFTKRWPCGEVERTRRAIRVFLLVRELSLSLSGEIEMQLPLTDRSTCIPVGTSLDLNNSDLITCKVTSKDGNSNTRRFLAIDNSQLILVEPHSRLLGWGVTKLAGFLQDIEVVGDKDESKCLHVTIHHTNTGTPYSAKFLFDDHIRCMAAKQKLVKGRSKARKKKMIQLAKLLDLPIPAQPSATYNSLSSRHQSVSSLLYGSCYRQPVSTNFASSIKQLRGYHFDEVNGSDKSSSIASTDSSPKLRTLSPAEEIQLSTLPRKSNIRHVEETGIVVERCCDNGNNDDLQGSTYSDSFNPSYDVATPQTELPSINNTTNESKHKSHIEII